MAEYEHEWKESRWKEYKGPLPEFPPVSKYQRVREEAVDYLLARDLDPALAVFNGWYPSDDWRIVIPCINSAGTPYYQARDITGESKIRYDSPVAPRGDSIVVVRPPPQLREVGRAVVMEGPMDALAVAEFGWVGIATMGNNPAEEAIDLIVDKFGRTHSPFLIVPDMDDPKFGSTLLAAFATRGIVARVGLLHSGKDLCELKKKEREKWLKKQRRVK